jgi:uncharacterized protein (DUF2384 family)
MPKIQFTSNQASPTSGEKHQSYGVLRRELRESERVLAIARLVGQADTIVCESGEPEGFNAAEWVSSWLQRPHAALGGKCPGELMGTADGCMLVSDLLARQQSGAYL